MAETLRDLAYGAALRGQVPAQPLRLPDTIQRLAMQQDAVQQPYRSTLADMVGRGGTMAQRLAQALDQYGANIPGTQKRITLKDLTLGDAGQVLEDWSYGSPPTTGGNLATGGVGTIGVQPRAMDLLNLGGVAGGAAKTGKIGADILGPTLREMARKGIEGNLRATGGIQDLITWHGSPHTFDKFDASKIGTGEGAQMYGHGLYLAEHPETAMSYQPRDPKFEQTIMDAYKRAEAAGQYPAMEVHEGYLLHKSPAEVEAMIAGMEGVSAADKAAAMRAHQFAKKQYAEQSAGALYKVDLPDPMIERMLDWDKPLQKQVPQVQQAIKARLKELGYSPNANGLRAYHIERGGFADATGDTLARRFFGDTPDKGAEFMRSQGIPGIRYLDEQSRSAGKGTSNFVVFPGEESALTILERNGRPLR